MVLHERIRFATQKLRLPKPEKPSPPAKAPPKPKVLPPVRSFHLGTNLGNGRELYATFERFAHQPHLLFCGAPGTGKTTMILIMLDCLFEAMRCGYQCSVFILNCKGALGRLAGELLISKGMGDRIELIDPSLTDHVTLYNPAKENSLSWSVHAKQLAEEVRNSTNIANFDVMQQMHRLLVLVFGVITLQKLTFAEAVSMLRPKSLLRKKRIPEISDPYLKDAWEYFDQRDEIQQDIVTRSSIARLESFVVDPAIRFFMCQQGASIDIGEVREHNKVLIADLRENDPLRSDDNSLVLRTICNDVIAHTDKQKLPDPTFLVGDEGAVWMTYDAARALERRREGGLKVWLGCQFIDQFIQPDGNTRIRDAVRKCIENRVVFRMADTNDCKDMAEQLFFDIWNPEDIKHCRWAIEAEPVEVQRETVTTGWSEGEGIAYPTSRSVAHQELETQTDGGSIGSTKQYAKNWTDIEGDAEGRSRSRATIHQDTYLTGQGTVRGAAEMIGGATVTVTGTSESMSDAPVPIPVTVMTDSSSDAESRQYASAIHEAENEFSASGDSDGEVIARGTTQITHASTAKGTTIGGGVQTQENYSDAFTTGTTTTESDGETPSYSYQESESRSIASFITFIKRKVLVDVQYRSEDEQMSIKAQGIKKLPNTFCYVQLAMEPTRILQAPRWQPPLVTEVQWQQMLEGLYQRPQYPPRALVAAQDAERMAPVISAGPKGRR